MTKLIVEQLDAGKRLDQFLLEKVGKGLGITRSTLIKYIEPAVKVNGKVCKKSKELDAGDYVEVDYAYFENHTIEVNADLITSVKGELNIIEETADYIVLLKPKGVAVHPGKGNEDNTIANYLKYYMESKGEYDKTIKRGGIIHRLDKDVSGILLCAKNLKTQQFIQEKFENREVTKLYLATIKPLSRMIVENDNDALEEINKLVENNFQFDDRWMKVDGHISRDPKNRFRMRLNQLDIGRLAITNILPLKNNQLLINIETGRMHQIRATLLYMGWVVVGDALYGDSQVENNKGIELEQILLSLEIGKRNRKTWRLV